MQHPVFNTDVNESSIQTYFEQVGKVSGKDYMKYEKGKDGNVVYMTGDDYINRCINDIFQSSYESVVTRAVKPYKVHEYAEKMKQGEQFPIPYLDYVGKGQEGRHRALAYKEAFGADAKLPVLVIKPTETTLDDLYSYCKQKYENSSLVADFMLGFGLGLGFTKEEIYRYLGIDYTEEPESEESEVTDEDEEWLEDIASYYNMTVEEFVTLPLDKYSRMVDRYFQQLS